MTNFDDDSVARLRKLGIKVQELTSDEVRRRRENLAANLAAQMVDNVHIVGLVMGAEEACSTTLRAFEFGDRIVNISKEEGKTYFSFGVKRAEVTISVQSILDLADLIRSKTPQ